MKTQELLSLAYINEKSGEKLYDELKKFGVVFEQIAQIRNKALSLLENFATAKKIKFDENLLANIPPTQNADNVFEAIIVALNYEIALNKNYDLFCQNCDDEELKDVFFRLWATSNNEYIVSLKELLRLEFTQNNSQNNDKNSTQNFMNYENLLNNYQQNFNEMSQKLSDILSGKSNPAELNTLLANPNFPFFGGLAIGALASSVLGKNLQDSEDDEANNKENSK
ncbi:MAG: ferritin-like domain-containing protein [Campylobacter sp.]|nr:ferritin-like domain-containing protein [Campylobacter sp.]